MSADGSSDPAETPVETAPVETAPGGSPGSGLGPLWEATGPHFFVDPADVAEGRALLRGDQARHLAVVLRARAGAAVSLADGQGWRYRARVARVGDGEVVCEITAADSVARPRPSLTVVHALPKGRKLDEVVEKLSEIGVDRLVPVHSARSQVRLDAAKAAKALARWESVALAAAKQSRRAWPLRVEPVGEWTQAFTGVVPGAVLWEQATRGLRDVLGDPAGWDVPELVLGIGPEGGLTGEEVAATGLPAALLGPTILRTETAALVAATVVLTHLGRLG